MNRAFVLINCVPGSDKSLIEELKHLDGVNKVRGIIGGFDIIAEIESKKSEKRISTISDYIKKLEHTKSINTLITAGDFDFPSPANDQTPDIIPDVVPDEKKPLEPPEETDEDYDDEDDDEDDDDY